VAWVPANFDHANIVDNCNSCHNGTDATGKGPLHVQTTDVCEDCHSTNAWAPVTNVDHNQVLGSCSSCHNGTLATGQNSGHFNTAQDCGLCHNPIAWTPTDYHHTGLPFEPLDHRGNLQCTECHDSNTEVVNWRFPAFQPDCAGCHGSDYKSGPHKKSENPDIKYSASELRNCSGACHVYTDSTFTTIKKNRPGPEHRISGDDF
jgi:predicted CXXCH cytochrome family protein